MIKVLIVVSGLVMFVPDSSQNPQGLTALLLDYAGAHHAPALRHQVDSFSVRSWYVINGRFNASFKVGPAKPSIGLDAKDASPQLGQLVTKTDDARVKPDCLKGNCKKNNKNLVAAVVRFEGNWRTRPLQRCAKEWIYPVDFREKALTDFRKIGALDKAKDNLSPRAMATALAVETQVDNVNELYFEIQRNNKSVRQTLTPSDTETCQQWLGDSVTSCIVLELDNWPDLPLNKNCDGDNPEPKCRVDEHFAAFYDLLENPPKDEDRWLPYVAGGSLKCPNASGPGTPPGIRCYHGFAQQ